MTPRSHIIWHQVTIFVWMPLNSHIRITFNKIIVWGNFQLEYNLTRARNKICCVSKQTNTIRARKLDHVQEELALSEQEIIRESRALCKGFYSWDIAILVARDLDQEGIKVWR